MRMDFYVLSSAPDGSASVNRFRLWVRNLGLVGFTQVEAFAPRDGGARRNVALGRLRSQRFDGLRALDIDEQGNPGLVKKTVLLPVTGKSKECSF